MPYQAAATELSLSVQRNGTSIVVSCRGRLLSSTCEVLYHRVAELLQESGRIVLDLAAVDHVDSMGLGTLVRMNVSATAAGSCIELANVNEHIRELLRRSKLVQFFGDAGDQELR